MDLHPDAPLIDAERLAALARIGLVGGGSGAVFDRLTELTRQVLRVPVSLVTLVHPDRQVFLGCTGLREPWASARQAPRSHSFCHHAVVEGKPLVVEDARLHPRLRDNAAIADLGVVAYLGVPLVTEEGLVLGTLCAIDHEPRAWTDEEVGVLRGLAASVMAEIRLRELSALLEAGGGEALAEERRRREAAERAWARFSALLERMGDAFVALDAQWNYVYVNARAGELFGRAPESLVGKHIWDEFPEGVGQPFHQAYERAMREQVPVVFEEYYAPWQRWFENRVYPSPDGLSIFFTEITERRLAEEALRRSEERQRLLLQQMPAALWTTDRELRFTAAQGRGVVVDAQALLGRSVAEVEGDAGGEGVATQGHRRALRGETARYEGGFAGRWFQSQVEPLRDAAGEIVGVIGVSVDVTERRAAEAETQALFGAMRDVILVLDREGRYLRVAPTGAELLVRPAAELEGRTLHEVLPAEQADRFLAAIRAALETRTPQHLEYRLAIGERTAWFSTTVSPLPGDTVLWMARDVTEARRSREVVERQAAIFGVISEGLAIADAQGIVTDLNPAAERIFGRPREEVLGSTTFGLCDIADVDAHAREVSDALDRDGIWHGPCRVERPDGTESLCEVTVLPLRDADGAVVGSVAVHRDVTERRALEEQLWHAQKMEITGRLAGGVAHDFNNLLTAIQGFAYLLEAEFAEGDPGRESLVEIQRAAERAAALTRHLLAFARKQVARPETLDVNAHLLRTLPLLRRLVGPGVELLTALADDLGDVHVDPLQLDQVLTNLVVNARDAMPRGGTLQIRTRNVTLGAADRRAHRFLVPGEYVVLEVRDSGIGMTEEVRERVFEPFFTTKEQGRGTGLGLSTVYGIVKQNDGFVIVDSAPDAGSTFRVYLPLVAQDRAVALQAAAGGPAAGARGTVLVAEDEEGVRNLVRMILTRAGYRLLEARDGEEAIRLIDAHAAELDLVLSDVLMPRRGGQEVVEHVRTRAPGLPVVLMSGFTEPFTDEGADAVPFLHKPFRPDELLRAVGAHLRTPRGGEAGR